jgi:hypothetical protein
MNALPSDIEIGVGFDATQAMNDLIALGYTAEEAKTILDKMGYKVNFTYEEHWFDKYGMDYGPEV